MLDRLLAIGSLFDWITPLWALIQDCLHGPITGFVVPMNAGWTPPMIRSLLQTRGITMISPTLFGSNIMFSVSAAQAEFAQYLLDRERIPFQGGVHPNAARPTAQKAKESGFADAVKEDESGSVGTHTASLSALNWLDKIENAITRFDRKS